MPRDHDRDKTPEGVFGAELRYYRTRAGLSQTDLAALVSISHDVISKIETGSRAPAEDFPPRLDAVAELDTRGALTRLWDLLKDSARHRVYPGWFDRWPDFEAQAKALRTFELVAVPGLLQTEDYARAMLRTQVLATDDEVDEMVAARLGRQQILARDKPLMLWVLLDEAMLRRPVGGTHVMREQLSHLIEAAGRPNIVVQVISLSVGAHQGMSGNFVIADFAGGPSVAYQDTAVRGQLVEDTDDIASLMVLWDTLKSEALPRAASLALIEEAAKTWT
jgi:transcriptional regulator with XRE-family HTH domain